MSTCNNNFSTFHNNNDDDDGSDKRKKVYNCTHACTNILDTTEKKLNVFKIEKLYGDQGKMTRV